MLQAVRQCGISGKKMIVELGWKVKKARRI